MRFRLRDRVTFDLETYQERPRIVPSVVWNGETEGVVTRITHRLTDADEEETYYTVFVRGFGPIAFAGEDLRHVETPIDTRVLLKYDDPDREDREATIERVRYHEFDHDDVYSTPVYLLRFDDGQSVESGADRFEEI